MKLRCYDCGEPIDGTFVLFALGSPADTFDRVFVAKPEHVARFDQESLEVMYVAETRKPK